MQRDASYWIETLGLTKHIEGGSFKEVYRSPLTAAHSLLPAIFKTDKNFCTSIYFLLEKGQYSAFHRIKSDELWHFYYGDPLIVYEIDVSGNLTEHKLGSNPDKGENFQCVIKAGNWFGSRVAPGGAYSLAGCTVSPGFDFADLELARRDELIKQYPNHSSLITELTYH